MAVQRFDRWLFLAVLLPLPFFFLPRLFFLDHASWSLCAVALSAAFLHWFARNLPVRRSDLFFLGVSSVVSFILLARGAFLGVFSVSLWGVVATPWYSISGFLIGLLWLWAVARLRASGLLVGVERVLFPVLAFFSGLTLLLAALWPQIFADSAFGHVLHIFLLLAGLLALSPWWISRSWVLLWVAVWPLLWIFGDPQVSLLYGFLGGVLSIAARENRSRFWWFMAIFGVFCAVVFSSPLVSWFAWPRYPSLARPSWSSMIDVLQHLSLGDWLFGTGVHSFSTTFFRGIPAALAAGPYWSLSFTSGPSMIATLFVQWGGILTLFLLVIFAFLLWRVDLRTRWLGILFLVIAFWWPLSPGALLLFGLLLLLSSSSWSEAVLYRQASWRSLFLSFFCALVFFGGFSSFLASMWIAESRMLADSDPERSVRLLQRATVLGGRDANLSLELSQRLLTVVRTGLRAEQVDSERLSQFAQASVYYAVRATALHSRDPLLWIGRSSLYLQLLQVADGADTFAVDSARQAVTLAPAHPASWNVLGRASTSLFLRLSREQDDSPTDARKEQITAAERELRDAYGEALRLRPQYVAARMGMSSVELFVGDTAAAARILEEGVALVPRDVSLLTQLGVVYSQQGKFDQAQRVFEDALALSPQTANARWYLTYVLEARGDRAGALSQAEILLERYPEQANVQDRVAALRQEPSAPVSLPEGGLLPDPLIDDPVAN